MRQPRSTFKAILEDTSPTGKMAFMGQLAALVVILQSSTLYLPLVGDFVSHFATLLVAMATSTSTRDGMAITLCAGFLLLFFAPKQIPILLLFDGPLGVWIGWGLEGYRRRLLAWPLASLTMVFGVFVLTWLFGIPLLNAFTRGSSASWTLLLTTVFSVAYVGVWFPFTQQVLSALNRRFN